MPSFSTSLQSVFFKLNQKHKLNSLNQCSSVNNVDSFGVASRPEEQIVAANPTFVDGVATKDLHIDPSSSVCVRIFLPQSVVSAPKPSGRVGKFANCNGDSMTHLAELKKFDGGLKTQLAEMKNLDGDLRTKLTDLENSDGYSNTQLASVKDNSSIRKADVKNFNGNVVYGGYLPGVGGDSRKLPVILQFHEGGFVSGSNVSVGNDRFCRRMAKLCDAILVAVGYRLAPESKYPAAFDDGVKVLNWLAKQAKLAECSRMMGKARGSNRNVSKTVGNEDVFDSFGVVMLEPWLAAHGDLSRCALIGVSCGANIANYVAQKAIETATLWDPVKVVAQVLMYPFFMGSIPTKSDIRLANTYFYDKTLCLIAWKLFLPEENFNLDHPAANPLSPGTGGVASLKCIPPTLTVVAEHDWMRDRAIAYSEELRKLKVDAPVLDYKDAVHGFATLDTLFRTPEANACAEDIAIWVKKYISLRGHEFSY